MPGRAEFERVVLPHLGSAYSLARWLAGDPAAAQDIVQDAALRALRAWDGFRGGDPRAWLLRIVRNAAYDAIAARGRRATVPLDHAHPDSADDPEAALARRQSELGLAERLAALPPELRECLVLRELEELSYKEIAAVTGAPVGTVMSRLWRARRLLLDGTKGCDDGQPVR